MRSQKKFEQEASADRWIVSYADFITLMFAFFVVIYAASSINAAKYKKIVDKLVQHTPESSLVQAPSDTVDPKFEALSQTITEQLNQQLPDALDIQHNKGWVEIAVSSEALFEPGSARLSQDGQALLQTVAKQLNQIDNPISIEGYTDNKPINTSQFPSNWELSAARSASVARLFETAGLKARRLSAVGFGEQHPVGSNKTEKGRALNRRVLIVIARDGAIQRLLDPSKQIATAKPVPYKAFTLTRPKKEVEVVKAVRLPSGGLKFIKGTTEVLLGDKVPTIVDELQQPQGNGT